MIASIIKRHAILRSPGPQLLSRIGIAIAEPAGRYNNFRVHIPEKIRQITAVGSMMRRKQYPG